MSADRLGALMPTADGQMDLADSIDNELTTRERFLRFSVSGTAARSQLPGHQGTPARPVDVLAEDGSKEYTVVEDTFTTISKAGATKSLNTVFYPDQSHGPLGLVLSSDFVVINVAPGQQAAGLGIQLGMKVVACNGKAVGGGAVPGAAINIKVPDNCSGGETISVMHEGLSQQVKLPKTVTPGQTLVHELQVQKATALRGLKELQAEMTEARKSGALAMSFVSTQGARLPLCVIRSLDRSDESLSGASRFSNDWQLQANVELNGRNWGIQTLRPNWDGQSASQYSFRGQQLYDFGRVQIDSVTNTNKLNAVVYSICGPTGTKKIWTWAHSSGFGAGGKILRPDTSAALAESTTPFVEVLGKVTSKGVHLAKGMDPVAGVCLACMFRQQVANARAYTAGAARLVS